MPEFYQRLSLFLIFCVEHSVVVGMQAGTGKKLLRGLRTHLSFTAHFNFYLRRGLHVRDRITLQLEELISICVVLAGDLQEFQRCLHACPLCSEIVAHLRQLTIFSCAPNQPRQFFDSPVITLRLGAGWHRGILDGDGS